MVTNRDRKSFWSRRKNSKSCLDDWQRWRFGSAFRHFGTHIAESFRMSKSSRMMDRTRSCEMPSYSAIDLAEIRWSSKINSWIWSIISGVSPFWVVQDEARHRWKNHHVLNWVTQFLTVAYDGTCSPSVSIRMAWISFGAFPCGGGGTWLQFASPCCWNGARRLTCFLSASVTRKKLAIRHMNRPLFPTTLSIPSYDIGK